RRVATRGQARHARDVKEIAQELHAIIEELALDDALIPPRRHADELAYHPHDDWSRRAEAYRAYGAEAHPLERPARPYRSRSLVPAPLPALDPRLSRLEEELQAETQRKEALLAARRQQDLELEELRRRHHELERKAAELHQHQQMQQQKHLQPQEELLEGGSATTQRPAEAAKEDLPHAAPNPPGDDGLRTVLRKAGLQPAPEMGEDMFVASLQQLRVLLNIHGTRASGPELAKMQALHRYVEQLEMDLDQKEESLLKDRSLLEQERQLREKAEKEAESLRHQRHQAPSRDPALEAAQEKLQAEVSRLSAELDQAKQSFEAAKREAAQQAQLAEEARQQIVEYAQKAEAAQEEASQQAQLIEEARQQALAQAQRAEAAETKLLGLVERIRGAATGARRVSAV
ncbi:unnamed protein product, partial [Symbiodinium pilosum]